MKKIIDGVVYDTETAECIAGYNNGHFPTDFEYFYEQLYRTKKGTYFVYGYGLARSKYGVWIGATGGSGEEIIQMTEERAKKWAMENLEADEYIEIFGEVEEA